MKRLRNQSKYFNLRRKYPYFEFQSYSFHLDKQTLHAEFVFNIGGEFFFKPRLQLLQRDLYHFTSLSESFLENVIFHIGMVELISYWKATCSPKVIIRPHKLTRSQVKWWKKLYYNGLGEFFYLNGITPDPGHFMTIESYGDHLELVKLRLDSNKIIVPVGGGKDSVVTIELLKRGGGAVVPMVLNPREASVRTIEAAGFEMQNTAVVERSLDPGLLELNRKGYLNGHTPFSALLAFVNLLVASAAGIKFIALSNESSASESTVPGTNINHQYSKSLEFENDFRSYCNSYISKELNYFSFLRPLNELQIAQLFVGFPSHFKSFRSCNVGSKDDSWCGHCPKCLFTYIILSPFMGQQDLQKIFGKDMFSDLSLEPVLDELTGKTAVKPFECIGTPDEVKVALWKALDQYGENPLPPLLKLFVESFGPTPLQGAFAQLINQFDTNHNIPKPWLEMLEQALPQTHSEDFLNFLGQELEGVQRILMLGFGKEGQSTFRLLKEHFPEKLLAVADRNEKIKDLKILDGFDHQLLHLGKNYLKYLSDYDLIIKSPGIRLDETAKNNNVIFSQTAFFLSFYGAQTIGVTGTKGKSTTVSLIHHILNMAGVDNVLLGNIGVPPFDRIGQIGKETVVVFELSAHQLENITTSPGVSILLNIFPEHLDYFGSFAAYASAKKNIFRYQRKGDWLIIHESLVGEVDLPESEIRVYGTGNKAAASANMQEEKIHLGTALNEIQSRPIPLLGQHNEDNILAALLAVSYFGISFKEAMNYLNDFAALPHRLEYLGKAGGISFYNDSISTVPESTIAALMALPETETLILGGFDRNIDYSGLVEFVFQSAVKNIVLVGQVGKKLFRLMKDGPAKDKKYLLAEALEEAFPLILQHTNAGSVCLLSPAAASYDQFHNFEHRGDTFRAMVSRLPGFTR